MKYLKLTIILAVIGLFGIALVGSARAATEFIAIVDPDDGAGTSFTTLSGWEAAIQADLTSATTSVFSFDANTASGTFANAVGVTGQLSGATATLLHQASSTWSNQLMMVDISGTFQSGEQVYLSSTGASSTYAFITDAGDSVIAVAKCRSTGGTADTAAVDIADWTTSADNYIKIWTDPDDPYGRHRGKWDENKYRLTIDSDDAFYITQSGRIDIMGLQISVHATDWQHLGIILEHQSAASNFYILNNIIKGTNNGSAQDYHSGIEVYDWDNTTYILNNIIYGFNSGGLSNYGIWSRYGNNYVFNNTVYDCDTGIRTNHDTTQYVTNNISQNCDEDYYGIYNPISANNISSDWTAPGTNSQTTTTVQFLDATNDDFHLNPNDTAARDAGTSSPLSWAGEGWGGVASLYYDIDGTARGAAFDIGADEVPVEFVSTICENTSAGGDCAEMDYSRLYDWEAGVNVDLTASTTRVFSGWQTGTIAGGNTVTFIYPNYATTTVTGTVVATTSDQILISGISGTSTPLTAATGSQLWVSAGNYWNIGGTLDELGASPIAIAKIDGTWNASDTVAVVINDWEVDDDNYIRIYTTDEARHNGKWNYGKYRIVSDNYFGVIDNRETFVDIDGLQINNIRTDEGGNGVNFRFSNGTNAKQIVQNNIITGFAAGVNVYDTVIDNFLRVDIYNNIIYGVSTNGIIIDPHNNLLEFVSNIYNNTIYNAGNDGISISLYSSNDSVTMYNNIVQDSANNDYYFESIIEQTNFGYNISSDETSPNDAFDSKIINFVSTSSDDFHLSIDDTAARDLGFDITSSSTLNVISGIDSDIQGQTRPFNGIWDIGADEYAHKVVYRSNGPGSTAALQCGGGTNGMTITSGSISNFQFPISDSIGVGDIIVYNSSSTLAMINGRTSSTTYSVASTTGYSATNISNDTGWCIYRAYTSLYNAERGVENTGIPEALRNFDDWTAGGDATTDDVGRDLVTNDEEWHIACYGDAVDSLGISTAVFVDGWVTGANNFIKIYTPNTEAEVGVTQRHSGKRNSDKYIVTNTQDAVLSIAEDYTQISGLQIEYNGSDYERTIEIYAKEIDLSNNMIKNYTDGDWRNVCVYLAHDSSSSYNTYIFSNFIYNCYNGVSLYYSDNATIKAYNNTIYNCQSSFNYGDAAGSSFIVINNISQDCGDSSCYSGNGTYDVNSDYNISNNSGDLANSGVNDITGVIVDFVDANNHDYHLAPNSPGIDAGTSSVSSIVTHDIDGEPIYTYDIGADNAARYFEPTVMESGGDFSTLASWETAIESDLTATSTLVFNATSSTGVFQAYESSARLLVGQTSGATAQLVHLSTTTSDTLDQFLAVNVQGTFISGEEVGDGQGTTTLLNAGNPAIAVAKIDGEWGGADTNTLTIDGWETGEYNYVKVYTTAEARHQGKWSTSKYRLSVDQWSSALNVREQNIRINGLQIERIHENGSDVTISCNNNDNLYLGNNIIRRSNTDGTGVSLAGLSSGNYYIWNNIVYGSHQICIHENWISTQAEVYLFNNTVYDCSIYGYEINEAVAYAWNNIAQDCNTDFDGSFSDSSHNISSDSTAPGTNSLSSTTVQFLDAANYDFHLSPNDTAARDQGTSSLPSAYSLTPNAYYDIDGTARGAAFDIGADELPVEFVSTICENTSAGGDCAEMDYSYLAQWEAAVDSDLTASSTRVFSGSQTGTINAGDTATFIYPNFATTTVTATVVATTSDQILLSGITGTTTPLIGVPSSKFQVTSGNEWTISGTSDDLGASPIAIAKIDGTWNASDTVAMEFGGWALDQDNYIKVYTTDTARHNGKWDYTKYRKVHDGYEAAFYAADSNISCNACRFVIDGLQIENSRNTDGNGAGILLEMGKQNVYSNNIILQSGDRDGFWTAGISCFNGAFHSIYNNIIYNYNYGLNAYVNTDNSYINVYNNTIYNSDITGIIIQEYLDTPIYYNVANNIVQNSLTSDYDLIGGDNSRFTSNISSDGSSPNSSFRNLTVEFASTSTNDFHLAAADSAARDQGYDLTSSSTLLNTDLTANDIDGQSRPFNSVWDIGADEYVHKVIYRSNGSGSTAALQCGGGTNTLNITGSIATTSAGTGLADNIGVGDAIVYNASSSIVFISGRTASTTYTVKDADGTEPDTSISGDTGWCIFRAYTSLYNAERGVENTGIPEALRNFDDWTEGGDATTNDVGRDLVVNNEKWNIACYGDAVDNTAVDISGWVTGNDNYLKIFTPVNSSEVGVTQRHSGKWNEDKYHLAITASTDQSVQIYVPNVQIIGLQISNYYAGVIFFEGLEDGATNTLVDSCILHNTGTSNNTSGYILGIYAPDNFISNSILIQDQPNTINVRIRDYVNIYNCTVAGGTYGFAQQAGTVPDIINSIAINSSVNAFLGSFSSLSDYNLSDDSTAPGSNSLSSAIVNFVDAANHDYHLAPDSPGIDQGTSTFPSAYSLTPNANFDIDGEPIYTYDIGADNAARYFEPTVMESGGDFSTLASWEAAIESDLTATSTLVFNATSSTGVFQAYESSARLLVGQTSGATAQLIHLSTTTSDTLDQFLAVNVHGTFITGEEVSDGQGTTTLLNAGNPAIAVAKIDGEWSAADTSAVEISGWETGKYNYVKVYTTETARHNGMWSNDKYRLIKSWSIWSPPIGVEEKNVLIDGLQVELSGTISTTQGGNVLIGNNYYSLNDSEGILYLYNNILRNSSVKNVETLIYGVWNAWFMQMANNIIYNTDVGIECRAWYGAASHLYNNTVYNSGNYGFTALGNHEVVVINNIAYNNTVNYLGDFDSDSSNNLSGPTQTDAPGTNPVNAVTVSFMDAANGDFRLMPENEPEDGGGYNPAIDAGTSSLAAIINNQETITNLQYDAAGNERYDAFYDIGALEGPTILYRSVGRHPYDLNADSATVTISSSTATAVFSADLPANVGVGDVIQFGGSGYYDLAFIHGRISSSTYDVRDRYGATPTATTTASAGVFRAHSIIRYWNEQATPEVNSAIDDSVDDLVLIPNTDLTASNTAMFVPCYASTSPDNLAVNIYGWDTATSNYIKVYTPEESTEVGESQRFVDIWDDDKFTISQNMLFYLNENYLRIEGVQREVVGSDVNYGGFSHSDFALDAGSSDIRIRDCYIREVNQGSGSKSGIYIGDNPGKFSIVNTVIYNMSGSGVQVNNNSEVYVYNTVIYSPGYGGVVEYAAPSIVVKNTVVLDSGAGSAYDFDGTLTIENCASDEGDGINAVSLGSSPAIWSATFVDYQNGDFRIKDTASPLYDAGTAITIVTDDIAGNVRPQDDAYDIGAFEYTGGRARYRIQPGQGGMKMEGTIKFK